MREQIESKLVEWERSLQQLQMQRAQVAGQLNDIDTSIQRHVGAIAGARELLQAVPEAAQPAADEHEQVG
jgi:hypothetical protein